MTEEIEAIAERLVVGHQRDGRRIYDPKARGELVRVCRQPGVSPAKIARTCGINANVLSNWLRQHERGEVGTGAVRSDVIEMPAALAFVAVQVDATASRSVAPLDVQVRLRNGTALELRGADLDGVLKLIDGLGRLQFPPSTKL